MRRGGQLSAILFGFSSDSLRLYGVVMQCSNESNEYTPSRFGFFFGVRVEVINKKTPSVIKKNADHSKSGALAVGHGELATASEPAAGSRV
jgi:hypothetical protein